MIRKLVLSVVVAVVVTLACILVGSILQELRVDIAETVGSFIENYASVFGVLAGLWYFFNGASLTPVR